jgi:hypothetical protein
MKKVLVVLAAAFATAAIAVTPAFAGGTVSWDGNFSGTLPCSGNEHWVLSNSSGVTGAELWVDGADMGAFGQHGQGAWSIDTNIGFDGTQDVSAVWTGEGSPQLVLSHCEEATSTTTTTTTGGPTTSTTSGGPTTSTTTAGPTTSTTSGGPTTTAGPTTSTAGGPTTGSGGVLGGGTTGGTTGGTAPSGGNLPFTGLPIWIPLLAAASLLASGIMLIRRRKGEIS